jgi:uncharacterized protein YbjT (DUF2867 family)
MSTRGVLVVGATGTQGGAVVRRLLDDDHDFEVYGLTRDPESRAARRLADSGVSIVRGDLWEPDSLVDAFAGVDAVYGMTDYWAAGYDGEVTQGINLANAAADAGVDHLVLGSVAGAGGDCEVPMVETKRRIERHVDRLGLPATVIRPGYFVQNFALRREDILDGTLALPLAPGRSLPLADTFDIGRLVVRALLDPGRFVGETVPLVGERPTLAEMAETFTAVLGRDVEPVHVPIDVARDRVGDEYADLFTWYNESTHEGTVRELDRAYDFVPTSLSEYLHDTEWVRQELPEEGEMGIAQ